MREALFYETLDDKRTRCGLCPHACLISDGRTGICGVRANTGGVLYAQSYGVISACALDPIEKKPLFHFHPGSMIFSIGNYGCNFRCAFCQNHNISMNTPLPEAERLTPEEAVAMAERFVPKGNIGIAYTYNEPLIGYEFVMDCAVRVHDKGLKNVVVTNGYVSPEPLRALLPYIDAFNIDLKAFNDAFYRRIGGSLEAVREIIAIAAGKAHVEVTTLIIPGENDSDEEIDALARFVAEVNPNIPLHLSRFFPKYQMADKTPTPKETVMRLREIAERWLHYVYMGNMR